MKNVPPSPEDAEPLAEAYKQFLTKALRKAREGGVLLHGVMREIGDDMVGLGKIGASEALRLEQYIQRDLADAAQYLEKTGKELTDWLGFDGALIELAFLDLFAEAADKTTTELFEMKLRAAHSAYRTGELTGLGTLLCEGCGEKLHFHKPNRVPPCPRCHHTSFHRHHGS